MIIILFLNLVTSSDTQNEENLFQIVNKYREEQGKTPFKRNILLDKAASMQAKYCADNGILTHKQESSKTGDYSSRIALCGYQASMAGENAAEMNDRVALNCLNDWKNSESHNKTLLDNYVDVGYASAKGSNGKIYWIGCFATGTGGNNKNSKSIAEKENGDELKDENENINEYESEDDQANTGYNFEMENPNHQVENPNPISVPSDEYYYDDFPQTGSSSYNHSLNGSSFSQSSFDSSNYS